VPGRAVNRGHDADARQERRSASCENGVAPPGAGRGPVAPFDLHLHEEP